MAKIHIVQDFDVPRERVFDFFSQHERLSEIYPGAFKRIKDSVDPLNINGLGSVRRITNFPLVIEETVTKFSYPDLIEYRITEGIGKDKHLGVMKFYELDNNSKSRLDYVIDIDLKFFLVDFFVKNMGENVVGGAIRNLGRKFRENPNY